MLGGGGVVLTRYGVKKHTSVTASDHKLCFSYPSELGSTPREGVGSVRLVLGGKSNASPMETPDPNAKDEGEVFVRTRRLSATGGYGFSILGFGIATT